MASSIFGTLLFFAVTFYLASTAHAGCTGNPPMFNGLPCATTTRYFDGQMGACGCGTGNESPFSWQWTMHTAAGSQLIYDPSGSSWCGSGCGSCYELTPSGDCIYPGDCAVQNAPVTVMVTNLCPYQGNQQWCPNPGNVNEYGYQAHFDLMDYQMNGWVDALGWNNPVVTYRQVPCGGGGSPSCSDAATCECATTDCSAGSSVSTASSSSSSSSSSSVSTASSSVSSSVSTASSSSSAASSSSSSTATSSSSGSSGSTPVTPPSSGSSTSCRAGISFALSSTWNGGGLVTITISNTGSSPITEIQVTVPGPMASWNLLSTSTANVYTLPSWTFPLAPGAQFTSAGYTFSGSLPPAGSIASISC